MAEVVVFGGTTEGRELAQLLGEKNIPALICVATEYGETLLPSQGAVQVHTGRLSASDLAVLLKKETPKMVIDATHPYAAHVSQTIREVCAQCSIPRLRVRRETLAHSGCIPFSTPDAMVDWLNTTTGVIFSTLGAKETTALSRVNGFAQRLWLRILPLEDSLRAAREAGFPPKHIICMQGPFSQTLNEAMFRFCGASILLTKESGQAGGFAEKLAAADACGMTTALLTRPAEEAGLTLDQIKARIEELML